MSDFLEQLRGAAGERFAEGRNTEGRLLEGAANEIDRLRAELAERDEQEPADAWLITSNGEQACAVDDEAAADILARAGCKVERLYRHPPAPAAVPDWHAITQAVEEMVDHYEYRGGEGDYTPTETERVLIQDAAMGALDTIAPMLQSAEPARLRGEESE